MKFRSATFIIAIFFSVLCSAQDNKSEGHVLVSDDGLVTIKSGIHSHGGTLREYWNVWTFKNKARKKIEVTFNNTSYKRKLHTIKKKNGVTYYITECYCQSSMFNGDAWLEGYIIDGDTIRQVDVKSGCKTVDKPEFEISYSIPDWFFTTQGAGYDWLYEYDICSGNLYIPIVNEDLILDRYELWHFNGNDFEYHGQAPHINLHESIRDYVCLTKYVTTNDFIIRVDSLSTKELRYASWRKPKTMTDKPDLLIKGGKRREYIVPPDKLKPCDNFRFTNGPYQYIVNYCSDLDNSPNSKGHCDYLLVLKNGKIILKQRENPSLE